MWVPVMVNPIGKSEAQHLAIVFEERIVRFGTMRFEYYPDTDTLYFQLKDGPAADAQGVAPNIVLGFNTAGEVIGIEIKHASQRTDLMNFQLSSFPAYRPAASQALQSKAA